MNRLEERIRTGLHATAERIPETTAAAAARRHGFAHPAGVWIAVAAFVAVLVVFTPILLLARSGPETPLGEDPDITPTIDPSQFAGEWATEQGDDTAHTMRVDLLGSGRAEVNIEDEFASVCSGATLQVTGAGSFLPDGALVLNSPTVTCTDGSRPETSSGRSFHEQFENLTFTLDPLTGTLTDSFGLRWTRDLPNTPGINWPQTNLAEVQEAQQLADAGDPAYAWQLEPNMESILQGEEPADTPEIYARFLQKERGWEKFALIGPADSFEYGGFQVVGAQLVRCEPGERNPLWPDDPRFGGCAPTIDDFRYESVAVYVTQPAKQGPQGLWVGSFISEVDPLEQSAPLTDAEIAAIVQPFLQARIAGEGAEQYIGGANDGSHVTPGFLYETSTGARFERAEFEVTSEQRPPRGGWMELTIRLFAEGGKTIVEQDFALEGERGGRWLLYHHPGDQSTENGVPLPRP